MTVKDALAKAQAEYAAEVAKLNDAKAAAKAKYQQAKDDLDALDGSKDGVIAPWVKYVGAVALLGFGLLVLRSCG